VTSEVAHESYSFRESTRNTYLRNHASQLMPYPQTTELHCVWPSTIKRWLAAQAEIQADSNSAALARIADHKSHHLQCDLAATRAGLAGTPRLGRPAFANDPETRLGDGFDRPAMTQHAHGWKTGCIDAVGHR
jgi:hypothetical protein